VTGLPEAMFPTSGPTVISEHIDDYVKGMRHEDGRVEIFIKSDLVIAFPTQEAALAKLNEMAPDMKNRGHFIRVVGRRTMRSYDVKSMVRVLRKILKPIKPPKAKKA
jgi:hypothetical protein